MGSVTENQHQQVWPDKSSYAEVWLDIYIITQCISLLINVIKQREKFKFNSILKSLPTFNKLRKREFQSK